MSATPAANDQAPTVGQIIKERMRELDVDAGTVSAATGYVVSREHVRKIMDDQTPSPGLIKLAAVCRVLEIPLTKFTHVADDVIREAKAALAA